MLTTIFILAILWVAWRVIALGLKLTWGITKILLSVVLPLAFAAALVYVGLMYVALPVLIAIGVVFLVISLAK